jgi:uncharacterized protein YbjT (DUF2867 family)
MPRVLVTGGNIGNHVAEELAGRGIPVRVLARDAKPNRRWKELGVEQAAADFADPHSLGPAFEDVDRFFSVTPFVENLVEMGINAVNAARRAGVRRIVRSSALGASEDGITMGRWHRAVEVAVIDSGIPYTILQPNTFMQSYLTHAETIRNSDRFYLPQGEGRVSLVDARDIAAVAAACLTEGGHEGKTYAITGPEALSNSEIATRLSQALGRAISYCDISPEQASEAMLQSGVPGWMTRALLELFAISKAGYVQEISPAVEQTLRRKPISFDSFLEENGRLFSQAPSAR